MPPNSTLLDRLIRTTAGGDRFQLVRYLIAGTTVSLGYSFTIVALASWLRLLGAEAANVVSLFVWTIVSYIAHREFTFGFDGGYSRTAARFVFIFLLKLGASAAVIAAVTGYYKDSYLIGVIANWVVLPLVSYAALKFWVFQQGFAL